MKVGQEIPNVEFKVRALDEKGNYEWQTLNSSELFAGKKIVLFALPGAFTPTCSSFQLPDFERLAPKFYEKGVDAIYCLSVNDSFVMNSWGKDQKLSNVKLLPDGNGEFSKAVDMLVKKENLGFGYRSWRYAAVINNNVVEEVFIEAGKTDNANSDPYEVSSPQNVLKYFGVDAA